MDHSPWRATYLVPRLGPIDARAGVPLLATGLHFRWWTVGLALVVCLIFWLAERRGLSIPAAWRSVRSWIAGPTRPPLARRKMRGLVDVQRKDF